jgi:putative tricarboxylic transport membrane protein
MFDIFLNLIWVLIGGTVGTILGLVPGLGVLSGVSLFILFLPYLDPINVILFYVGLIVSSQFMGSVFATFFGIPGETTSVPASKVGYSMFRQNKGTEALVLAGTGSFFAGLVASGILLSSVHFLKDQYWIYSQKLYAIIFLLVILYLIFIDKKILSNLLQVILGLFLGSIGNNDIQQLSLTFGQAWLNPGLDIKIFILNCFVLPILFSLAYHKKILENKANRYISSLKNNLKLFLSHFKSWARGTFIGLIIGLIPGIGVTISSNVAWILEKKLKSKNESQLISAESANNSAHISSLFPLIVLGLPILASEAIILSAMETKGGGINFEWFIQEQNGMSRIYYIIYAATLISLIMYFIATTLAKPIISIVSKLPLRVFKIYVPLLILLFSLYLNYIDYTIESGLFTLLISAILGFFVFKYKIDSMPLIFSFLISNKISQSFSIIYALWIN